MFSESAFAARLKRIARAAGCQVVCKALQLYYLLRKPDLPKWARNSILGALVYLVSPLDAIPDFIPVIGYTDDLTVLAGALAAVAIFLDAPIKEQARARARELLGADCDC